MVCRRAISARKCSAARRQHQQYQRPGPGYGRQRAQQRADAGRLVQPRHHKPEAGQGSQRQQGEHQTGETPLAASAASVERGSERVADDETPRRASGELSCDQRGQIGCMGDGSERDRAGSSINAAADTAVMTIKSVAMPIAKSIRMKIA